MGRSQIALEFVILMGMAIALTMVLIVVMLNITQDRNSERVDVGMNNFGKSLQDEFLVAAQMNDGYARQVFLYDTIENTNYTIAVGNNNTLIVVYNLKTLYYRIPTIKMNGILQKGYNTIAKYSGTIYLN